MKRKHYLITGSAGFVGREFQRYYADAEVDLTLIDIKQGRDCRDFFDKETTRYDLVIHLAATVEGRAAIDGEPLRVASNLELDSKAFNWAVRTGQPRLVYYSSSAAYPVALQAEPTEYHSGPDRSRRFEAARPGRFLHEDDIDLNDVRSPDASYGWAKLTGEMLAAYARAEGVAVHVLRPFSGYGTDQDLTYPFASFIRRIVDRRNPFTIWGSGHQVRDFIHISDVVRATLAVVEADIQVPVNLGNARPTSFIELAQMMFAASGWRPPIAVQLDQPVGVFYRCSDNTRMTEVYRPSIDLETGIALALAGTT